jgi:hypothetical protein
MTAQLPIEIAEEPAPEPRRNSPATDGSCLCACLGRHPTPGLSRVLRGQNAPILLRCPARYSPRCSLGRDRQSGQPPRRLFQRLLEPLRGRGLVWADGAASAGSPSPQLAPKASQRSGMTGASGAVLGRAFGVRDRAAGLLRPAGGSGMRGISGLRGMSNRKCPILLKRKRTGVPARSAR